MRVVGLDIHRVFAEAVMLENGTIRRLGRVGMTRDRLAAFARTLADDDHVVVEATGNASAVAEVIRPHVGRVVIANPRQVRLIAEARIKTDVIDATVLARLYASGFLPEVWIPDGATLGLRRQVIPHRVRDFLNGYNSLPAEGSYCVTVPLATKASISSRAKPNSRRISVLCSPIIGGGRCTRA